MPVTDDEIERIISVIQTNCAMSGGCTVFLNNDSELSCVMGDKEICYITQEEGADRNTIRDKIRNAV